MNYKSFFYSLLLLFIFASTTSLISKNIILSEEETEILKTLLKTNDSKETYAIISSTGNYLNCQTPYIDLITSDFYKKDSLISFKYIVEVEVKNESFIIKKFAKKSSLIEDSKLNLCENNKCDFLFVHIKNGKISFIEFKTFKSFYENEFKLYVKEKQNLQLVKTLIDYNAESPIIYLNYLDSNRFVEYNNYDILRLDSNLNFNVEYNFYNQLYRINNTNGDSNSIDIPPVLSSLDNTQNTLLLYFSSFLLFENENYYLQPRIFELNLNNYNFNNYNFELSEEFIQCITDDKDLYLLHNRQSKFNSFNNALFSKYNRDTKTITPLLYKKDFDKYNNFKNYVNINSIIFFQNSLLMFDIDNKLFFKCNKNNLKDKFEVINFSNLVKSFKSPLNNMIFNDDYHFYIIFYNEKDIVLEKYNLNENKLIDTKVFTLPDSLQESKITYVNKMNINNKLQFLIRTDNLGYIIVE